MGIGGRGLGGRSRARAGAEGVGPFLEGLDLRCAVNGGGDQELGWTEHARLKEEGKGDWDSGFWYWYGGRGMDAKSCNSHRFYEMSPGQRGTESLPWIWGDHTMLESMLRLSNDKFEEHSVGRLTFLEFSRAVGGGERRGGGRRWSKSVFFSGGRTRPRKRNQLTSLNSLRIEERTGEEREPCQRPVSGAYAP